MILDNTNRQNGAGKVAGQRGEKVLSEEELGATEERDIAPEGRHFFKISGRRLIVKRTFVISLSSIVNLVLN